MKEAPRRRITVTSSLKETSTDQLGNRVVMRGGGGMPDTATLTPQKASK